MATLNELLAPQVILESVTSRIKQPGDFLQQFLGFQMGGPANLDDGVAMRYAAYDIFDNVQDAENMRAPGTAPDVIAPNPVGQVPVTIARAHTKVPMYYEQLGNQRPLGKTSGNIDRGGMDYIRRQETILKQRFQNFREFMASAMLRGSFTITFSGDSWIPTYAGGTITVDFRIPAGNKTQLDMLGAGNILTISWASVASAPIFENILAINAAFQQLHGWPLTTILCNSVIWGYVTNNAGIKARSGTSNVVFDEYSRNADAKDEERARDGFTARLKCLPFIEWKIYDGGLKINGAFTKHFADTAAAFLPDPSPNLFQMLTGGEYICENEQSQATVKRGLNFWPQYVREPSRVEIVGLDNCIPAVRVPKAIAYGTVVF